MNIDTDQIIKEIRANQALLDSCPKPHDFSEPIHRDGDHPSLLDRAKTRVLHGAGYFP